MMPKAYFLPIFIPNQGVNTGFIFFIPLCNKSLRNGYKYDCVRTLIYKAFTLHFTGKKSVVDFADLSQRL